MPEFIDYYAIMGVPKSASEAEIKSAYRKLAMKYHPDRNPGNKEAEARFKSINEANEVLSDPGKRRTYDQLEKDRREGRTYAPPPGGQPGGGYSRQRYSGGRPGADYGQFGDFSDFFNSIFGGGGGGFQRGGEDFEEYAPGFGHQAGQADMEAELTLSLSDLIRGGQQSFSFGRQAVCRECGGRGRLKNRICPACGGAGHTTESREMRVNLPKGLRDGTRIRLKGQGGVSPSGRAGDLYVNIRLASHPDFTVEGSDIVARVPVLPWDAALGAEISVPAPDGAVKVKLPAGSRAGRRLRISGRGLLKILPVRRMEANGFQPGMAFGQQAPLFMDLPFKPVGLGAKRGQGRKIVLFRVSAKRQNTRPAVLRQHGPQTHTVVMHGLGKHGGNPRPFLDRMDHCILKRLQTENRNVPDAFRLTAGKRKLFRDGIGHG